MINPQMDPVFAAGLREALVEHVVTATAPRSQHRRRWLLTGGAVLSIGVVGGGVAVAQDWLGLPGADRDTPLSESVSTNHTGSATVHLGDAPAGTNAISLALDCLSPGTLTFPDGASVTCTGRDAESGTDATYTLALAPGQTSLTIDATATTRWGLVTTYVSRTTTDWAVNAKGQTYGVINDQGTPDLVAAIATNGRSGYLDSKALAQADGGNPTSPAEALAEQAERSGEQSSLPVYEADGSTIIGYFVIG